MSAVYKAIAAVQGELAKVGISKDGQNTQQNYKFRGIDQVYGALSPLLAKHGLCVLPRIVEREMHERVTVKEWNGSKKESVLFYVTVTAEFDFVAVADGSSHTVRTYGEAMDSGDKATNKAMSAAYKYAAFMAFAIPTEGDNDADATTHDVAPRVRDEGQSQRGAVSPHPDDPGEPNRKTGVTLAGPHKSITSLEKAIKAFAVEMGKVGDMREWYALKNDNGPLLAQAERDHPDWWNGWASQPDGFTPLRRRIEILEAQLIGVAEQQEAAE
jgi:hypothetical protein